MNAVWIIVAWLVGYLLGAVPASYLLTRWLAGVDLRTVGSGNLGFTNASRVLGAKVAIWALVYDVLKGLAPAALFPRLLGLDPQVGLGAEALVLAIAVAPVGGHVFPVFMKFKGGKGVATSLGVFLALAPWPTLVALAVGILLLVTTRYMSLVSMGGAVAMAVATPLLAPGRPLLVWLVFAMAAAIVILHRSNIRRLLSGTERKFGLKASAEDGPPGLDDETPMPRG